MFRGLGFRDALFQVGEFMKMQGRGWGGKMHIYTHFIYRIGEIYPYISYFICLLKSILGAIVPSYPATATSQDFTHMF